MSDPFNYPFPQRNDLMSLSTIGNNDVGVFQKAASKTFTSSLYTSDIKGAQPTLKPYFYTNKTSFINKNEDIIGSQSRQLIRNSKVTSYQLINEDINGAKPSINKFKTVRKPTNPLTPEYILPKVEMKPPSPKRFIRDAIDVSDIEGTRPRKVDLIQELNAKNQSLGRKFEKKPLDEIPGTRPRKMFIPKDGIDILDVKDINSFRQFKTTRLVNPLEPKYIVGDENKQKIEIGEIEKNRSKILHPNLEKDKDFNLKTGDINGAWADTHADLFLRRNERRDHRDNMITKDISGAMVGSLKKGIESLRHTNPIWPKYQYIGEQGSKLGNAGGEVKGKPVSSNSLGKSTKIEIPKEIVEKVNSGKKGKDNGGSSNHGNGIVAAIKDKVVSPPLNPSPLSINENKLAAKEEKIASPNPEQQKVLNQIKRPIIPSKPDEGKELGYEKPLSKAQKLDEFIKSENKE